jgi:hypothetical protein
VPKGLLKFHSKSEKTKVRKILEKHQDKTFVQRVLNPKEYPSIDLGYAEGPSTHLMSWGTTGRERRPIVYPSVIYDHRSGTLRELSPADAMQHAELTGQFIPFDTKQEADWFSKRYKAAWEKTGRR